MTQGIIPEKVVLEKSISRVVRRRGQGHVRSTSSTGYRRAMSRVNEQHQKKRKRATGRINQSTTFKVTSQTVKRIQEFQTKVLALRSMKQDMKRVIVSFCSSSMHVRRIIYKSTDNHVLACFIMFASRKVGRPVVIDTAIVSVFGRKTKAVHARIKSACRLIITKISGHVAKPVNRSQFDYTCACCQYEENNIERHKRNFNVLKEVANNSTPERANNIVIGLFQQFVHDLVLRPRCNVKYHFTAPATCSENTTLVASTFNLEDMKQSILRFLPLLTIGIRRVVEVMQNIKCTGSELVFSGMSHMDFATYVIKFVLLYILHIRMDKKTMDVFLSKHYYLTNNLNIRDFPKRYIRHFRHVFWTSIKQSLNNTQ